MTNGDKIRQMSNEELVGMFYPNCHFCLNYSKTCSGDFLGKEAHCTEGIKAYLDMEVQDV